MGFPPDIAICGGRGSSQIRRRAGAIICALIATALLGPFGASAAAAQKPSALESLIAALGAARADKAVNAIGHGLVLMEAQKRIAATERKLAREAAAEPEPTLATSEEVMDPSEMAPASAGTNGTTVPHHGGGRLFAHSRGAGGSTAILLSGIALAPPDAPE